jgi:hypothetical protein
VDIWIPRRLYEILPYIYGVAGLVGLGAGFLHDGGPRGLLMLLGGLCLTAGLVLWMRRRDYRDSQTEYDSHSLDR